MRGSIRAKPTPHGIAHTDTRAAAVVTPAQLNPYTFVGSSTRSFAGGRFRHHASQVGRGVNQEAPTKLIPFQHFLNIPQNMISSRMVSLPLTPAPLLPPPRYPSEHDILQNGLSPSHTSSPAPAAAISLRTLSSRMVGRAGGEVEAAAAAISLRTLSSRMVGRAGGEVEAATAAISPGTHYPPEWWGELEARSRRLRLR